MTSDGKRVDNESLGAFATKPNKNLLFWKINQNSCNGSWIEDVGVIINMGSSKFFQASDRPNTMNGLLCRIESIVSSARGIRHYWIFPREKVIGMDEGWRWSFFYHVIMVEFNIQNFVRIFDESDAIGGHFRDLTHIFRIGGCVLRLREKTRQKIF